MCREEKNMEGRKGNGNQLSGKICAWAHSLPASEALCG